MPDTPTTVIELLRQLVQTNSVNRAMAGTDSAEAEIGSLLESLIGSWGLDVQRLCVPEQADQLLVTYPTPPNENRGPWLLFDAHMDTVGIENMTVDPFGAVIEGDRLYGRGAADVQGPLAAIVWALRNYADADAEGDQPNNIAVLLTVDEESTMSGVQQFVSTDMHRLGWQPEAVIVAEPTDFHPVIAHNGCIRWTITTHGQAAHSSTPHEGHSAISDMMRLVQAIESDYIPGLDNLNADHPLTGPPRCSVNVIRGGSAVNIIPDSCTIEVDRRVSPLESMDEVEPAFQAVLDSLESIDYTRQTTINHPPLSERSSEGPLLHAAQSVLSRMNLPTVAPGAPFVADSAYLASPVHANLPTLVFGPGSPHTAHTKDEWVSVQAITRGVEMYERLMRSNLNAA